jgi:oligopeptide transport system substrate-binding protein
MLRHLLRTVNLFDTAKSALFLCFLAACHGQTGTGEARGLIYYETYDPRSLDPALSTDVPTGEMVTLLFDGLTQFDPDGKLLPALSDRWTADRKGQRYVFHLRAGVSFTTAGRSSRRTSSDRFSVS